MHIHQITIHGFKSYKDQTLIEEFSPKHNVIVGKNGSGKSNFFAAIRFVLSDAYSNMSREERQSLLHEGSGLASFSAFVEIVFMNEGNRFPTGKEFVHLRRTIGMKKDEYSLDRKSIPKSEVMSLLESAGFSRSNPYYIVPQGRITMICNSKDVDRLNLLKDVAGTHIYEQRRVESIKIMEETEVKKEKILDLLKYIEERLTELECEKNELKEFYDSDRKRRAIEYTIYHKEQCNVLEQLEDLEELRSSDVHNLNAYRRKVSSLDKEIKDSDTELFSLNSSISILNDEKNLCVKEKTEISSKLAHLELLYKDCLGQEEEEEGSGCRGKNGSKKSSSPLSNVLSSIANYSKDLIVVKQELESLIAKENSLFQEIEGLCQKKNSIHKKYGRNIQFKSRKDRDKFLRTEIDNLFKKISNLESRKVQMVTKKQEEEQKTEFLNHKLDSLKVKIEENQQTIKTINSDLKSKKQERDILYDKKKIAWKSELQAESSLSALKERLLKYQRELFSTMDKNTSSGLTFAKKISKKLNIEVCTPLYELFEADDKYNNIIDIVAGKSLFHLVVETEEVATSILEILSKERCGRVTFMPLDRLSPNPVKTPPETISLIDVLKFDKKYIKAFQQVFGKTVICDSLDQATRISKSYNINAITFEGDRVERKGSLHGGFHEKRRSRMDCIKIMNSLNIDNMEEKLLLAKNNLKDAEMKCSTLSAEISRLEIERRRASSLLDSLNSDLNDVLRQIENVKENSISNEFLKLENSIKLKKTNVQELQHEITLDVGSHLNDNDMQLLQTLTKECEEKERLLTSVSEEKVQVEKKKNLIDIELNLLANQKEEILGNNNQIYEIPDISEIKKLRAARNKLEDKNLELHEELSRKRKLVNDTEGVLEKLKGVKADTVREMGTLEKNCERYLSKKNILLRKKEELTGKIRELGALPEDAFVKYQDDSSAKLMKNLHKVNEVLKKFDHVNKKAFEQYNNFTKQQESLTERRKELDASADSIRELIKVLDQRKDEAIERTFQQVSESFTEIFEKLVVTGTGSLVMKKAVDNIESNDDSISMYTGVGIQVSFNSKSDQGLVIQQLSGGQKSLVALALIFAIQKCDPAPFYLFDEIDANLDAAYRTSVANMIHELSESAQFITTTFRPELLKNADKFYGVVFSDRASHVSVISREEATNFVDSIVETSAQ